MPALRFIGMRLTAEGDSAIKKAALKQRSDSAIKKAVLEQRSDSATKKAAAENPRRLSGPPEWQTNS
jgi:hypothetical protein